MKIAGVQMDVSLGNLSSNLDVMGERLRETRKQGAELTIFPECCVTGYCFDSLEEGRECAEQVPGQSAEYFQNLCKELGGYVVYGTLERVGDSVFNAAVLVGAEGMLGNYRKIHLPWLGIDRFATHGDQPFAVHQAGDVRVAMNICYDVGFPEAARSLSLLGAELIALPTNWPPGAEALAQFCINARAMENAIYFAGINRVGSERGFHFIGLSRICAPTGETLAASDGRNEEILYAEIDPAVARGKRVIRIPGVHVIDRHADRRPEMYHLLTEPHQLPRPGRDDDAT